MTNEELYNAVEKNTEISKEVTDIFLELDRTMSMTTQASLNQMLCRLYRRLDSQDIIIDILGDDPCTPEEFRDWVDSEMDDYTRNLFLDEIEED